MPVTRTTLLSGPATASFLGRTFHAQDGILVTPALELEVVDSDAQGILDSSVTGLPVTIRFSPSAPFHDLLALYPFLNGAPGRSLFGAEDTPLVLVGSNGVRLTFSAVAITQMPDLSLTSRGAIAGAVTFLAKGARELPVTAANRLVTIDTTDVILLNAAATQLSDNFSISWGGIPWMNINALDGVDVSFVMKTTPVLSDANALVDLTLESLAVTARFTPGTPSGPAERDVFTALQAQGAGASPGRPLSQGAHSLNIAGEHLYMRLPLAQLISGPLNFDASHPRVGELVFAATRALLGAEPMLDGLVSLSEGEP